MLRAPKPVFERLKLVLILAAYIGISEWTTPLPWRVTIPARLAVAAIVLVILRELHHGKLETNEDWAVRTRTLADRLRSRGERIPKETWLKLQRVAVWLVALYAYGLVLDSLTDRCDGAIQCVGQTVPMAVANVPTFLQFAIYLSLGMIQMGFMFVAMVKTGSYKVVMPGTIPVTFDDVYGQDKAKQKVMEQVKLLDDSAEVEDAGGYMPKGLLLYGPPGTGKTYLAKAAANYSSKPLVLVPPGAFQATFVGINLLKVWVLFRTIRKLARRWGGVVCFMDEIDSLGRRGGEIAQMERPKQEGCIPATDDPAQIIVGGGNQMGTLEAFLSSLDGLEEPRGMLNRLLVFLGFKPLRPPAYKYFFLAATNMPDRLDPALTRPGRLGRKIKIDYPTFDGRLHTYNGYLDKVEHSLSDDNIKWAAHHDNKGTGASIKDVINEALLLTYRDERSDPGEIKFDDLMRAMRWVRFGESDGPFVRAGGRWSVAVHEAGHAVAFHYLNRHRQKIWFASIEQHGRAGGMVAPTSDRDDWLLLRSELLADIQVSLASRVAEEMILGEQSNGHGGDGKTATERAAQMVRLGHGTNYIGAYETDDKEFRAAQEAILREALDKTRELFADKRRQIEAVARLLEEKGTCAGDAIHSLLEEAA